MSKPKILFLAAAVLIAGAVWGVYGRALNSPFVFDDTPGVLHNTSIRRLWPLVGNSAHPGPFNPSKDLPTSGRPLVNLSLALNYHFGQLNPAGYHAFNIVMHILSALLLMAIVRRTLCLDYFGGKFARASGPLAFIAALLWALHPLVTETVVYVTQRTELLVGFFYLATLYTSLRYWAADSKNGRIVWLGLATLACLAGMACKEVMVTAPIVVLLFERTFLAGSFRKALRQSWPLYFGLFLGWALLLWLNHNAPRSGAAGFDRGVPAYIWWLTQTKVFWMYLKLCVWPWPLAIHYEMPYLDTLGAARPWLAPMAILMIATLLLLWRRNTIGFVGAWVLLILSPTLIVPIVTEVAAERRMYLPLAALLTLFVVGGYWLVQKSFELLAGADADRKSTDRWPEVLTIAVGLVLAVTFGMVGARHLAAYHDPVSLWEDTLASQPDDPIAHNNLGIELLNLDRLQDAIAQIQLALQLKPEFDIGQYNLGLAEDKSKHPAEAIQHYRQALQLKPDFAEAEYNLGIALEHSGKLQEAIEHYRQALRLKPNFVEAYNALSTALTSAGQMQEAIEPLRQALQLDPDSAAAHDALGVALTRADRVQEGIDQFNEALRLKPEFGEAHLNLGVALAKSGRLQEGIDQFQEALRIKPNSVDAYANMTKAYALMQRPVEAIASAEKGLALARLTSQKEVAGQFESWLKDYRAQHPNTHD